jgi:cardiolipin synthase
MILVRQIPNIITGTRILCVPYLILVIFQRQFEQALLLIVFMGLSDGLDGFLARSYGWQTRLGSILDPIADKLMLLALFVSFGLLHWVPWWLVIMIALRDMFLSLGAMYMYRSINDFRIQPLFISKLNTFMQIVLGITLIFSQLSVVNLQILNILMTIVACTTVASASQYYMLWLRRSRRIA